MTLQTPLTGAARPWVFRNISSHLLTIFPDLRQVRDYIADQKSILSNQQQTFQFEELPFREGEPVAPSQAQRGETFTRWLKQGGCLVTTPSALISPLTFGDNELIVHNATPVGRDFLINWLIQSGYERVELVWSPGQFASRGSIVDLYSPGSYDPIRVEFFDEDVESIRFFNAETQKSLTTLQKIKIKSITARKNILILDMLPESLKVVFFSPKDIETAAENATWLYKNLYSHKDQESDRLEWAQITGRLGCFPRVRITQAVAHSDLRLELGAIPSFKGNREALEVFCHSLIEANIKINLVTETQSFVEWGIQRGLNVLPGSISQGFIDSGAKEAFIGDLELSGVTVTRSTSQRTLPLEWGDRFSEGDILIHENYGLCSFVGSETLTGEKGESEYLVLQFAEGRKLMMPIMQSYLLSEYTTYPGQEVALDNLRGTAWKKASEKARLQAEEAARYLIEIHAAREITKGYAYPPNDENMQEFEKTFPYTETVDQLRAINDVYLDMQSSQPMDRLVVGDVGFGKTEIALRAVAKAVFAGKQALLMAPTTLLVQQHFETFQNRLESLGVRVEMISRFISVSKIRKIVEDTKKGLVDVIVGTHRLLGKDITFADLGLVVIDEEHRFGVAHKEHLKKVWPNVDVLLLSATPIPRSLYLSLAGLRDMSLLQTPPCKRLPVISVVSVWSESLVKNAILREVNRGGQIYFVHNRIHSIDERALMLRRLFPDLKIDVAHGRMSETDLEMCMRSFSEGQTQILLSTTIVESGLDIPRANTLIIDDAQELGLAQLYQLRGRVGRREEQAFALFMYPSNCELTKEASERLEAIAELDDLGAGYRLSRRDLQIRGGGDLAGFNQHGHVNRIGFQLYCTMLEDQIARLQGKEKTRVSVEISLGTAIPETYLPQATLRISLYRKLLSVSDKTELLSLKEEVRDRFGALPVPLRFLFDVAFLRVWGQGCGVSRILCEKDQTMIEPLNIELPHPLPAGWSLVSDVLIGGGGHRSVESLVSYLQRQVFC